MKSLLSFYKRAPRIIVGLITGHSELIKYLTTTSLAEEALCRFWREEKETTAHALRRPKVLQMAEEKLSIENFLTFYPGCGA